LLATIKVHSSYSKFFDQSEYRADLNTYSDILSYLESMHPKFNHYINMINCGQADEGFAILDSKLNTVTDQDMYIKRVKDGDTIYLAPIIAGGGGKRGGLLALVAIGVFAFATGGLGAGLAGGAAGAGGAAAGGAGAAAAGSAGAGGGIFNTFASMPAFAKSIVGNLAMSLISSIFTKKPKQNDTDTSTRDNGMFGSLTNSTTSGTPIALHYGLVRAAGQFVSGYVESEEHGKNDVIKVGDKF